ncbi:MAG: hypothetical protein ACRDU4_00510 [Mycobacterium sp.]
MNRDKLTAAFDVVMRYHDQERFIEAADPTEPIETYIARRDLAMKHAVPFEQWMAKHRDRLVA